MPGRGQLQQQQQQRVECVRYDYDEYEQNMYHVSGMDLFLCLMSPSVNWGSSYNFDTNMSALTRFRVAAAVQETSSPSRRHQYLQQQATGSVNRLVCLV